MLRGSGGTILPKPPTRVLGRVRGPRPGPTLLAIGGMHGNEPAGVLGLQGVVASLGRYREGLAGELVALSGNRGALGEGRRFLRADLNRIWTRERVRRLQENGGGAELADEAAEQLELLRALQAVAAEARGPLYVLDLHTTSATSGPWGTVEDTLRNREFAMNFPVPIVLGLEEQVDGTLLEFFARMGHVSLTFEGGRHDDPCAVERSADAVWIGLSAAGILGGEEVPEVRRARERLARETREHPRVLEMRYRHGIGPDDGFRMRPGYVNLQPVRAGEVVGRDRRGEVQAPESGRLLMPLYQEQGEDGFFVVREFRPFWLRVSAMARRLGLGRFVHWLPGIRRASPESDILVVDRRVARWFALDILHLLGYRKQREMGDLLLVLRRTEDEVRPGPP